MQIVVIFETSTPQHCSNQRLSGEITPKINLTLLPEFDGRAGEPWEKASRLVEDSG